MIDPTRLIEPPERLSDAFPGLGFRDVFSFQTSGGPVLLTDPVFLADVFNSGDQISGYLRTHGVIVMDFGGDASCAVLWKQPFAILPISRHLAGYEPEASLKAEVLADEVGTDSGSFIFLPLDAPQHANLAERIEVLLSRRNAVKLALPAGKWRVLYEQWDPPPGTPASLYRNVVLEWQQPPTDAPP